MLAIGIDVGIEGAIAAVGSNNFVRVVRMPIIAGTAIHTSSTDEDGTDKKRKRRKTPSKIDGKAALVAINTFYDEYVRLTQQKELVVGIETQQAMPKQGVVSMFHLGESFGLLQGIVIGSGYRLMTIKPKVWKDGVLMDTAKDKTAAIVFALNMYPQVDINVGVRKTIHHDGMADALCIATYVSRMIRGY